MANNLPHNVIEPSTRYMVNVIFSSFLQVLRNHELVGQIRLDELEARLDRTSQEEGQPVSDIGAITDCDEVSSETQTETLAEMKIDDKHLQIKDACQSPNPAELKDLEQEDRQRAGTEKRPEVAAEEAEDVNRQPEKKDIQIQENQNQLKPRNGDGNNVRNSSLKEKIVKLYEGSPDKRPGLPLKGRMFNDNDAKIEEHILRCVLQLEKDGSTVKMCRKSEMDLPSKAEMKMEAVLAHNHLREYLLFNNWSNNLKNQDGTEVASTTSKTSPAKPNSIRIPSHFTIKNKKDQGDDEVMHRNKKPRLEEDGATKGAENPRDPEGMPQYSESKSVI